VTVCLAAYALRSSLRAGAYIWMFLNWALGLRDAGCSVIWLDSVRDGTPDLEARSVAERLERLLERHGIGTIAVIDRRGIRPPALPDRILGLDAAAEADLFLDLGYDLQPRVVRRFRRSAFVDIDPGLTQVWLSLGQLEIAPHDVYFTLGENVGKPNTKIPTAGISWLYTPPPVHLSSWPVVAAPADAPYTTVSSWWSEDDWIEVDGRLLDNSKRAAFLPYLSLPHAAPATLELAIPLKEGDGMGERARLRRSGWSIRHVDEVSASPDAFRSYVQRSRGEFSCLKRGYAELRSGWTGERALAYLASGKPAILEDAGPSRLPDREGLLRFASPAEAAQRIAEAEADYGRHCAAARALAETHFDAVKIVTGVLERALR
jgi:hypothetical protein